MEQFSELLLNTLSIDNAVRKQAETQFETISLQEKTQFLTQILSNPDSFRSDAQKFRSIITIALVHLRKVIDNSELYDALQAQPGALKGFRQQIVNIVKGLALESAALNVQKKLGDLLADATFSLGVEESVVNENWPECISLLITLSGFHDLDQNTGTVESLAIDPAITMPITLNAVITYPEIIKPLGNGKIVNLLARCFEMNNFDLSKLAARATCAYLINVEPDEIEAIMGFAEIMNHIMQTIVKSVCEEDDDSVIKQFIDVVECSALAPLLKNGFNDIITLSLSIISKPEDEVSDDNKQLALEVVISLIETHPGLLRKLATKCKQSGAPDPVEGTIQACIHLIQMVDDDEEWLTTDKEDDTDIKSNSLTGEASIDRLACALRGGVVLPRITALLPGLMSSSNWQQRYAGVTTVSAIAEGCHQQMAKVLPDVLKQILIFCGDSHGRVRFAAANCLGQLAIDFQEKFTKMSHEQVIPQLCNLLDDVNCPKVIGQSASALVNFVESLPNSILKKYTDVMISKIEANMNREASSGRRFTLQQLVTLLASIAGSLDDDFSPYFERFMPGLNQIIQSTVSVSSEESDASLTKLRGKAIECYSIIGLAVGAEKFGKYAKDFMDAMLKVQLTPEMWAEEDETISYTISAWARMSKVLGEEFSMYLPQVMPPLLQACRITPEVQMIGDEEEPNLDEEKWQVVRLPGDTSQLGIKTSCLELKATACSMLVCYCREVGASQKFAPYMDEIVKLALQLLTFYFHEDVRVHAAEILESVVKHHGIEPWQAYDMCSAFISAIQSDPDETVVPELLDMFAKSIENLLATPEKIFKDKQLSTIFEILGEFLKEHIDKSIERSDRRINDKQNVDEGDEEEMVEAAEEDEYLLNKIADMMHSILGTQKEECLPDYDQIHHYFERLIDPSNVFTDRQWAICVFDDIIERCGSASLKYAPTFLNHLVNGLNDEIGEIRQACSYGIGILAKSCHLHNMHGTIYDQALQQSVVELKKAIQTGIENRNADAKIPDDVENHLFEPDVWENAVSALGKILRYKSDILSWELGFDAWLDVIDENGGFMNDTEEAEATYQWFNLLLEQNMDYFLGVN